MRLRRFSAVLLLLLLRVGPAEGQTSQMKFTLPEGPYRAGFRTVEQYDFTRSFEGNDSLGAQPRPLQTSIWYPARIDKGSRPMLYKQYAYLTASETSFPRLTAELRASTLEVFAAQWGLSDSARRFNELEAPTRAFLDAPQAPGNFPVVIYGPSSSAPSFENSVLMEYLASQGYVVISSPCMGWYRRPMTLDLGGIEAQSRDMEFLLAFAASLPGTDMSRVAMMGFSWGGISNVLVQLRNPRVRALVALDGSIAYFWKLFKSTSFADLGRMDVPFLFLQSAPESKEILLQQGVDTSFTFFESLRYSAAYRVQFSRLRHQNFGAHFVRLLPRVDGDADQATVNYGYEQIARYTLNFLDAYLRDDRVALDFMARTPERNGIRRGFATVDRKRALRPVPTLLAFIRLLGPGGPASAPEALAHIWEKDPGYRLPEAAVNAWGYELLGARRYDDAVGVLTLNTFMYPQSSNTWDSLGEAFMEKGDRESAILNYMRSLACDGANKNAMERLAKLRAR